MNGSDRAEVAEHMLQLAEAAFWRNVRKGPGNGCWEWMRGRSMGYGFVSFAGTRAHRLAWMLTHGPIRDGLYVLHHCDNKPCVRPDHLFLGTHADNMADLASKGLLKTPNLRGADHPNAKLSRLEVHIIRSSWVCGDSQASLAKRFGVNESTIGSIVHGKSWTHLPMSRHERHEPRVIQEVKGP